MNKNINFIMLIDDNSDDNFYHEWVIKRSGATQKVVVKQSGNDAINYLMTLQEKDSKYPDLILLDINMPGMNGWEFLTEFNKLPKELKEQIVIIFLTTSENPDDIERAKNYKTVSDFRTKPLTKEMLNEITHKFF